MAKWIPATPIHCSLLWCNVILAIWASSRDI